jgi:hypothetical protein
MKRCTTENIILGVGSTICGIYQQISDAVIDLTAIQSSVGIYSGIAVVEVPFLRLSDIPYHDRTQTEKQGEGIEYVKNRAASGEEIRFYACGGDGTLYDVVNGAFGFKNVQVAVIPLGSGNDFIRLFGTKDE